MTFVFLHRALSENFLANHKARLSPCYKKKLVHTFRCAYVYEEARVALGYQLEQLLRASFVFSKLPAYIHNSIYLYLIGRWYTLCELYQRLKGVESVEQFNCLLVC